MKRKSEYILDFDLIMCPIHNHPIRGLCTYGECGLNRFLCAMCRRNHPREHLASIEFIDEVFNLDYLSNHKLGQNINKIQARTKKKNQLENRIKKKMDSFFDFLEQEIIQILHKTKNDVKAKIICSMDNNEEYHLLLMIKNLQDQLYNAIGNIDSENIFNVPIEQHLQNYNKIDSICDKCTHTLKLPLVDINKLSEMVQRQLQDFKVGLFDKLEELGDQIQNFKPFQYHFNHVCYDRLTDPSININLNDNKNITVFDYIPDNQMVILNNKVGEFKAFKINTFESITKTSNNKYSTFCNVSSRKEAYLGGNNSFTKILYDNKPELKSLEAPKGVIVSMQYLPNKDLMALGLSNKTLVLYHCEMQMLFEDAIELPDTCSSMGYLENAGILVMGLVNGQLLDLNIDTNKVEQSHRRHSIVINYIEVSKNQRMLVSCDALGDICIWKYCFDKVLVPKALISTKNNIMKMTTLFSVNQIVLHYHTNIIEVWDINKGKRLKRKIIDQNEKSFQLMFMKDRSKFGIFNNSGNLKFLG